MHPVLCAVFSGTGDNRIKRSTLRCGPAQWRNFADTVRTSTGVQGRVPFKPKVVGSIPTAPTNHLFFER